MKLIDLETSPFATSRRYRRQVTAADEFAGDFRPPGEVTGFDTGARHDVTSPKVGKRSFNEEVRTFDIAD